MRRTAISLALCLGLLALATPALAAPGSLDTTFNATGAMPGTVRTDFTNKSDEAVGMAIQSNQRIVAVGAAGSPDSAFAVARYMPDGTLDTSFGTAGKVTTNIGPFRDAAISVAIQSTGEIVVAGGVAIDGPDPKIGVVRYLASGALDTTFGPNHTGIVVTDISKSKADEAAGVAIQSDGKIVATGLAGGGGNADFAVVRYLSNGSPDTSFGSLGTGIVRTDFGTRSIDAGFGGVAIQPADQFIVVGGYTFPPNSADSSMAVARYDTSGALDTTFSGDGKFTLNVSNNFDFLSGIALEGTKIVGAGESNNFANNPHAALIRVTAAGSADTTFGPNNDGIVTSDPSKHEDFAAAVAIDLTGNIVTAGGVGFGGNNPKFYIARFTAASGAPDAAFGTAGEVFTDLGTRADFANFLGIQADGKIVAAGGSGAARGNNKFALARYLST